MCSLLLHLYSSCFLPAVEAKAAEEAKKGEAEDVLKKLLASGMTAEEILAKLQ